MAGTLKPLAASDPTTGDRSPAWRARARSTGPAGELDRAASRLALFCALALLLVAALALLGAGSAGSARAQDAMLPDPTRPPTALRPSAAEAPDAVVEGPLLQSVIISEGRRGAIISGQYVALGGRVGDARLARVEPSGVVLRGPAGELSLPLFPAVRKQPAGVAAGAPAASAGPRTHPPAGQVPPRRQEKQQ
jgi:MSHA biogenesis protein MshK